MSVMDAVNSSAVAMLEKAISEALLKLRKKNAI
jgi:hypothetical protein